MRSTTKTKRRDPLAPVAVPLGISRLNCEAICGLTERQLYDLGRAHNLPRLPGKVPVYRADAVLALFANGEVSSETDGSHDEPTNVDAVLARIGRRAGAR